MGGGGEGTLLNKDKEALLLSDKGTVPLQGNSKYPDDLEIKTGRFYVIIFVPVQSYLKDRGDAAT